MKPKGRYTYISNMAHYVIYLCVYNPRKIAISQKKKRPIPTTTQKCRQTLFLNLQMAQSHFRLTFEAYRTIHGVVVALTALALARDQTPTLGVCSANQPTDRWRAQAPELPLSLPFLRYSAVYKLDLEIWDSVDCARTGVCLNNLLHLRK